MMPPRPADDPSVTSCGRCGGAIKGRRSNGYCSDACRMRDRRELEVRKRRLLVEQLKQSVSEVERELLGENQP